mgnify:CR=1 FL=1
MMRQPWGLSLLGGGTGQALTAQRITGHAKLPLQTGCTAHRRLNSPPRYSLSAQLTMSFFRVAARAVRAPAQPRIQVASRIQRLNQARTFSVASVKRADVDAHDPHHEESFEEFTARCVHLPVHNSLFSHSPGTHSTV